jgi:hypothetical protein
VCCHLEHAENHHILLSTVFTYNGLAIAQVVSDSFPIRRPKSVHVAFLVDKAGLGQDLSECFGFPCQF